MPEGMPIVQIGLRRLGDRQELRAPRSRVQADVKETLRVLIAGC